MGQIFDWYNSALEAIPAEYRVALAVVILGVLIISLVKFLRRNLLWIVLFIILLPAAWPSLKQITLAAKELLDRAPK